MNSEVEKISANGISFAYRWDGRSSGDVVMMAHAMGTSLRIWDDQVAALADKYRILRYDWRGHGGTDAPPGPYSLEQFSDDAVAVMDALNIDRVHWVGISTGGMIGQGLGIHHANRLHSLALCNTTPQSTPWYRSWVAQRQSVVRERGMVPVWDMTKALWFTDAYVARANADYERIRQVFIDTPVLGYLGGTSAVADLNYASLLHNVRTPTLVIAAGDDPVTPLEHSQTIHANIAGSRLVIIDGQRHFSNVEAPAEFSDHLDGFLAAHH
jgi:3-oxoadipate enol-lactonase